MVAKALRCGRPQPEAQHHLGVDIKKGLNGGWRTPSDRAFIGDAQRSLISSVPMCEEVISIWPIAGFADWSSTAQFRSFDVFQESAWPFSREDLLRKLFETVVARCMKDGLVGGEAFAVDASMIVPTPIEAAASPRSRISIRRPAAPSRNI
jgi:hypothetical protein